LLTFSSESDRTLIGCGVDGETVARFSRYADQDDPLPMVFSRKEVEHIRTLPDKALAFCSSFCCKEAVFKAMGAPFNFTECELFYLPGQPLQRPVLSFPPANGILITDCTAGFLSTRAGEQVAVVHLYGRR
jgi:phosphopantetheinyl transferase (holo-ACP synthase)